MLTLVQSAPAFSHGGADDPLELFRGREGPYEAIVSIVPGVPTVGTVHFSITLLLADTRAPVTDAQVTVVATDPNGELAYRARALNSPDSLEQYEANITFESPGLWTLSADIHSDVSGDAAVVFRLDLGPQPLESSSAGAVVFLVVLVVLVGGSVYLWHSNRRRRPQPVQPSDRPSPTL